MRRRCLVIYIVMLVCVAASGCMPYASNFTCPKSEDGKCGSLTSAYEDSLQKGTNYEKTSGDCAGEACKGKGAPSSYMSYRDALNTKLADLLNAPTTPMVKPPTVMRVLLLPYVGEDGELFDVRYSYVMINDFSWVTGEYLLENNGGEGTSVIRH